MADFMIYARESGLDAAQQPQYGQVWEVRESGAPRGDTETLPLFAWVECPEVSLEQVADRSQEWRRDLDFQILSRDLPNDGWQFRISNLTAAVGGFGGITRAQAETFLTRWGANIVSEAANQVVIDWRVFWGATSPEFWGANVSAVVFNEQSYDPASGVHRIRANYSGAGYSDQEIVNRVNRRGGTNQSQVNGTRIDFDLDRATVVASFQRDVRKALGGLLRRRRYYVSAADMALLVASGGVMQVTAAQLANRIRDARAE